MAHEDGTSLEGSFLNNNLGFWEEFKQLFDLRPAGAKEHRALLVLRIIAHSLLAAHFDNKVGSQVKQYLILAEE